MKLIRYEIWNNVNPKLIWGVFVFPEELLDKSNLTLAEIIEFNLLVSELYEPEIDIPVRFYFTEKGYIKFLPFIQTINKMLLSNIFYLHADYLDIDGSDNSIVYKDDYQVGIKYQQ